MDMTITAAAEKFIRRMLRFDGGAGHGFRIIVTAGGCSGLAGDFSVEPAPRDGELVYEHNGLKFFLPAQSRLLLSGVTIDFTDTPTQTGLVFHDPKTAGNSCGSSAAKARPPALSTIDIASIGRRH